MARRSHKGLAYSQGERRGPVGHVPAPSTPDPRRAVCTVEGCGRALMYVRRTYGPHAKAGHWQHVGDGLRQYRSW